MIIIFTISCQENIRASYELKTKHLITEIPLPSDVRENQIHDFVSDGNGALFISTEGFLWRYVGNTGHKIYTDDLLDITWSDTMGLYASNEMEVFLLEHDPDNKFILKKTFHNPRTDNPIQDIFFFQDHLILKFRDRLSYLKDNKEKIITGTSGESRIFLTDKYIFINNKKTTRRITPNLNQLNVPEINYEISGITDNPDGYLIIRDDQPYPEIFSRDFKSLGSYRIAADRFRDIQVYNDKKMVILLKDNSILLTDKNGYKLDLISNNNLNGNEKSDILISPDRKLWQFNENFIWLINYPSRFRRIELNFELPLYDITGFNEDLYFATSEGIVTVKGEKPFKFNRKVFKLFSYSDLLFYHHEKGISVFDNEAKRSKNLFSGNEIILRGIEEDFFYSKKDSLYLMIHYDFTQNRFQKVFKKKLNEKYTFIYPFLFNLSGSFIEVFNVNTGELNAIPLPLNLMEEGIKDVFSSDSSVWIHSSESVYYLHTEDSILNEIETDLPDFIEIESMKVMDDRYLLGKRKSRNSPGDFFMIDLEHNELGYFTIPSFPAYYSHYFAEDYDKERFILGTSSGLFLVKKSYKNSGITNTPEITRIIAGNDTLLNGISLEFAIEEIEECLMNISFSNRDVLIGFSSPDFLDSPAIFQYRLEETSPWSDWFERNQIYLEDLKSGNYNLSIRFMGNDGDVSGISKLAFNIERPLYFSRLALIIYGIIVLILLFIFYKKLVLSRHRTLKSSDGETQVKAFHREEPAEVNDQKAGASPEIKKRRAKWDKYQMVTVLFSDIQGFTRIAEQMNPEKLIDELDRFFFHFDSVVEKYHIEKIKTIGDAYMAAGGIPMKNRSNPVEVVLAALEMQHHMSHLKQTKVDFWDLRIGIHTGPVIAGVVGHKKRSYDIWGDTVNTASRMESSGEAGKVNISGETFQLVREYFLCEYRGKLPVKYKGNLDMYFVKGLRPELSVDLEDLPNRKFFLKLQLLRLLDLEDYVFQRLEDETPDSFKFHTPEYARQMYNYSELISKAENLDTEETLLIRTAILMIPLGYLSNYMSPELESSLLCHGLLYEFHYSEKQIRYISNLILASKYPPEPENLLEKIMVDIRFEYLGRADYLKNYKLLFEERNENIEKREASEWREQQIELLKNFNYFTHGAHRLSEISFEKQIERLMNEDWGQ